MHYTITSTPITVKATRKHLYTPLRYPGGKTSLFEFFDEVIKFNRLKNVVYIEPYAGGAGAALSLLLLNRVDSIVINDFDVAIYSFWKSILDEPEAFIKKIETTPITVGEWHKQKEIYKNKSTDVLALGFATFFLNRTNRSGILNGGIIGGQKQEGKWKIDARYNRDKLVEKIKLIASVRDKIEVFNKDGLEIIRQYMNDSNSLFYVDPPYYEKGASLYLNSYKHKAHEDLADLLNSCAKKSHWILTYDNVEPICQLYLIRQQYPFVLQYQAHSARKGSEVMILSDTLELPKAKSAN